jgi:hypothetical protein
MNNCKCSEQVEQLRRDVAEAIRSMSPAWRSTASFDEFLVEIGDRLSPQPKPLKACPVCGGEPQFFAPVGWRGAYRCHHTCASLERWRPVGPEGLAEEPEARRLWNTLPGGAK